jgi:hypothetical protein
MFRYKVPVFENGKKTWQDEYQKLAPIGQYDSVAALRKDGLVPKAPDTASLTPERTQLLSEFVERIYFPGQTTKLKASTLRSYHQVYECYVKPRTNGSRMCDFILPSAQKFLDGIASEKTLSTSSFQKIKWFMVAVFDAARISGAYDHNSLNPFADVKLPKNRRPKQPGRYATLENVSDRWVVRSIFTILRIELFGQHSRRQRFPGADGMDFRRGLATNLHTLDVNDLDIQRIMRYSDVAVTRASYIKVPDATKKAAMARLENALKVRKTRKKAK